MALTAPRDTHARNGEARGIDLAAAAVIYQGALVAYNAAGYLVPGSTATDLVAAGRAEETVDNTDGANGDLKANVRAGVFRWTNSGSDTIDRTHIGGIAYIVDDETVAATDGTGTRSPAGEIFDVDADGVWVRTGL